MPDLFAKPRRGLKKIWYEWIELHETLERELKREENPNRRPTAPFFSAASRKKREGGILVVGKATDRDYWSDDYRKAVRKSPEDAIRDRLERNRKFVRCEGNRKAFWKFLCGLVDRDADPELDSVIWSNVAKIGSHKGNPAGRLLSAQEDLAKRTLVEEVREYKSALVVFVTANYADKIINDAFGFTNKGWERSPRGAPDREVWLLRRSPAFPKVRFLWVRHPQGKTRKQIDYWTKKARKLIAN